MMPPVFEAKAAAIDLPIFPIAASNTEGRAMIAARPQTRPWSQRTALDANGRAAITCAAPAPIIGRAQRPRFVLQIARKCLIFGGARPAVFTATPLKTATFAGPAKPFTPVQFRAWPPSLKSIF
jgi:hypothetical protein